METILLFAPLVGALIAGFGHGVIGDKAAQVLTTALLFLSAILSWAVFLSFDGQTESIHILRWIESGTLSTDWAIRMDRLTDDHVDRDHHRLGLGASLFHGLYGS